MIIKTLNKFSKIMASFIIFGVVSGTAVNADVTALGFTINKSTEKDLKKSKCKFKKVKAENKNISAYIANASCYKIDGLKQVYVAFKNKTTKHIVGIFDKEYFNSVKNTIDEKYTLQNEEIPFVGDAHAQWNAEDENVTVRLNSPHLSFEMQLIYIDNGYLEELEGVVNEEENEKLQKMNNAL